MDETPGQMQNVDDSADGQPDEQQMQAMQQQQEHHE